METLDTIRERLRKQERRFTGRKISVDDSGDDDFAWMVRRSGIPAVTFESMRFEKWEDRPGSGLTAAVIAARDMASGEDDFHLLTLAGPTGVGKTHIALAIAWEWLLVGAFVRYYQVGTLLDELRASFSLPSQVAWELNKPTFDKVFEAVKLQHLLVLDDLGVEKPTEWAAERLDTLIDHRWLNRLPTVVTTNAMSEELPPRVVDRLRDFRCAKVVQIAARSYRSQKVGQAG